MKVAWACSVCGKEAQVAPGIPVRCRCGVVTPAVPQPPSLVQRLSNYAVARMRWEQAGRPVRTNQQVADLRLVCASCVGDGGYFDGEVCTHKLCGCTVSRASVFGDKLRWETEHCPIAKW